MRRKGFTLIELLVVVAIIVILAGILYPVFASTRRAAYSAACISNLKQIGLAVNMYTQDYDETFPTACDQIDRHPNVLRAQPDWPTPTAFLWVVVKPYVKNDGLWRCPADGGFSHAGARINWTNMYKDTGSSYRYNTALAWVDPLHPKDPDFQTTDAVRRAGNYWSPLSMSVIQKPSETYIAAEPSGYWHNSIKAPPPSQRTPETDSRYTYHYNGVHVDGHAKMVLRAVAEDIWTGWGRKRELF